MTPEEFAALWRRLSAGEISPRAAVFELMTAGNSRELAEESVFYALGGSDVVEIGKDGVKRYFGSGKTVAEIAEAMKK